MAALKRRGLCRRARVAASVAMGVILSLGTPAGYWLLRREPTFVKLAILAFTAGTLMMLVVEEMAPRAHLSDDARLNSFLLLGGFAVFTLLALYID